MKLISIITPAYNAGKFIAKTIDSVLAQTYGNYEMLIVDDCSSDDTVSIVESYATRDERIKLIRHEKNQGVAAARNTALAAAVGEYVAFLDSDDMWMPKKLERQLAFMEENGYVLTYTAYQKYFTDTDTVGKVLHVPTKMTHKSIFSNTAIACLTVMINRERSGEFSMPPLKHFEDQCTWQSILARGYVAYGLDENLALYRVSSGSLTANKKTAVKRQWAVYREYFGFSVVRSAYYFLGYAIRAVIKHL